MHARRRFWVACTCIAATLVAAPAAAQLSPAAIPFTNRILHVWPTAQLAGEFGLHSQPKFTAESVAFGGWYRIIPTLALELTFSFFHVHGAHATETTIGNPFFGWYYVHTTDRMMVRVGGGLAPGVATSNSSLFIHYFVRGMRDAWLLLPHSLSFVPRFRLDLIVSKGAVVGWDVDLALHVPVERGIGSEVTGQLGVDFTARPSPALQLGLRAQLGTWLTASEGDDTWQFSLVPFVRALFGPAYAELRFLFNLDDATGYANAWSRIWTVYLAVGARVL